MLNDLLNIKKMHLDRAEQAARKARSLIDQCKQALAKAQQELQDYQTWRLQEEKKIYKEIIGQQVAKPEVEQTRQQVADLRMHDEVLIQAIEEAEQALSDAQEQLKQAISAQQAAYKTVEKYKEIIAELQLETERAQALQEEKEMEELYTQRA